MDETAVNDLVDRGVTNVIPSKQTLLDKLNSGEKLNVYMGIDPTATRIHIGHAVPLRKLQQFAKMGHNVTFLIGDFTTLIGDTSDKESERPILTKEEIEDNFKTYKSQAEKIVDFASITVKNNSEWLGKLNFEEIIKLAQHFSVGEFVNRELIRNRLNDGKHVRLDETLYPVMQGYDSYFMDTDIQIGGADQTFNMQAGRTLQKNLRNKESFVLVTDYLTGTDGRKMSKSWGNAIWLTDTPDEMYGKVMSLHDDLINQYLTLATSLSLKVVEEKTEKANTDPMGAKKDLAYQIVKELYDEKQAQDAQNYFESTFQQGNLPQEIQSSSDKKLVDAVANIVMSKTEAKRLINQKAIEVDGKIIVDPTFEFSGGETVKIGKKKFVKIEL